MTEIFILSNAVVALLLIGGIRFRFPNLKKTSEKTDPTSDLPPVDQNDQNPITGRNENYFQKIHSALSGRFVKGHTPASGNRTRGIDYRRSLFFSSICRFS